MADHLIDRAAALLPSFLHHTTPPTEQPSMSEIERAKATVAAIGLSVVNGTKLMEELHKARLLGEAKHTDQIAAFEARIAADQAAHEAELSKLRQEVENYTKVNDAMILAIRAEMVPPPPPPAAAPPAPLVTAPLSDATAASSAPLPSLAAPTA